MRKMKATCTTKSHSVMKFKGKRAPEAPTTGIFRFLSWMKKYGQFAVAGVGASLVLATIIGGAFFDLTASQVAGWFLTTIGITFAAFFIIALVAFLGWFLWSWSLPAALISIGLIGLFSYLLISPDLTPFWDLGAILEPLLSFLDNAPF